LKPSFKERLSHRLGVAVRQLQPLAGGDINSAFSALLGDGTRVFVKTNSRAPHDLFEAEAQGLNWLRVPGGLRVPEVIDFCTPDSVQPAEPPFLVLEYIDRGRPGPRHAETLGRGLAALHRAGTDRFGLSRDNYIGWLVQSNRPVSPDAGNQSRWCDFYRSRRLEPLVRRATDRELAPARLSRQFDRLFVRLEALCGPEEPPARLHGDLWGGNCLPDDKGAPVLIDPAVYGGHREVDLAMMKLFGGFSERAFAAYDEAYPLQPNHTDRVPLYQLYPLLVHLNLFGGTYLDAVDKALVPLL